MKTKLLKKGEYYYRRSLYEKAYTYFLESALTENNVEAMYKLGLMYLSGYYVARDYTKAFSYFKKAYDVSGSLRATMRIMTEYDEIAKDIDGRKAYKDYFDYLIERGEWSMYIPVGGEYGSGKIYEYNVNKQIECYEKAVEKGIEMGYDCLGELYFYGKGVEQDYKKAYEYLSGYEGETSSVKTFILAEMYRNGFYLEQNTDKAIELYRKITEDEMLKNYEDEYYMRAVKVLESMNELKGDY